MQKILLASLFMLLIPSVSFAELDPFADDSDENKELKVTADLSLYDYTPKSVKKAAFLAFLKRNWDVESAEDNHFVGKMDVTASHIKVEMTIKNNQLEIKSVKGSDLPKKSWLFNLKKDFLVFLVENSD
jgi:hypothetical protein